MSEKEKKDKNEINFKVISSDTSIKVPNEDKEQEDAVKDLLAILKPKVVAPKPISAKPISLGSKKVKPIQFSPIKKPQTKPIPKITTSSSASQKKIPEIESDILISDEINDEDASDDLLKMNEILKGIKEDEIAERLEEQKPIDIPENSIIGITVECPHCGKKILLDRLEFLKQGYSDYCPSCNLMLLPDILPEDYEPIESTKKEE
ncbi:MAG: hypothetical protein ACTSRG_11045 [Candidatus Helarchaeota archaeon]